MNRNLFNLKNAAIVAVLTLVAFIGFNSFTAHEPVTKDNPKTTYTWVFTGTLLSQVTDTAFYTPNPGTLPLGCGSGTDLPCQLIIDGDIDNKIDLKDFIVNDLSNDPDVVLASSETKRFFP